jgi:hypothetical protein
VLELSALGAAPTLVLEILDRYEQAWLAQASQTISCITNGVGDEARAIFVTRILEAKLSWVHDVRRAVEQLDSQAVERFTP